MPASIRGANSARSRAAQRRHLFTASREKIDNMNKDELLAVAEEAGVLDSVPRNGQTSVPLADDIRETLYELRFETL